MTGRALYEDLTLLNVDSWDYFAALSRGPDSLVMVNDSDASKYWPMKHMWAIGNYSKFIKGYTRVEVEESSLPEGVMGSAYLAPDGKKLVFVAVNEDTASQTVTLAGGMRYQQHNQAADGPADGGSRPVGGRRMPARGEPGGCVPGNLPFG